MRLNEMNNEQTTVTAVDIDKDIQDMNKSAGINYDDPRISPLNTDPESLMTRYKQQSSIQSVQAKQELEDLENEVAAGLHSIQPMAPPQQRIVTSSPSEDRMTNIHSAENFTPNVPRPAPVIEERIQYDNQNVNNKRTDAIGLREQIERLESQLQSADYVNLNATSTLTARSFLDDFGDETFFIQNTSSGHVMVTDLDLKIPRGKVVNLLKFNSLEEIKASRDMKIALSANPRSNPLLRRLTPEEYIAKLTEEVNNEKKIDHYRKVSQLRAQTGEAQSVNKQETARPIILDKINKLKLGYSDQFHKGITPVEFAQWVNTEDLSKNELDLILGHVDDQDLRILINEKKKTLIEKGYK